MIRNNFDRYGNQVARLRLERDGAQGKPAKASNPKMPDAPPIQPQAVPAQKSDWVNMLVEAVEREGSVTFGAYDLSILLGLPATKNQATMLTILEAERRSLFTKGVRYFGFKGPGGHAIHFRMLKLDSL